MPLATQVVANLTELRKLTGHSEYAFPSARGGGRHMSQAATPTAMRGMGLSANLVTHHGWRATPRTLLDEAPHFPPHLIEHQLAHTVKDPLGRAYSRAARPLDRKAVMRAWADDLDGFRSDANVVALGSRWSAWEMCDPESWRPFILSCSL